MTVSCELPASHEGIVFAVADGQPLHLDLIVPATQSPPVVVYVHGGGWVSGGRADMPQRLRAMAAEGIAVASIDYRLAPEARYPKQLLDVRSAICWLRNNGKSYGLDVSRIGVWGASAGGYLAVMAGCAPKLDLPADDTGFGTGFADAVVSWFGIGDMAASVSRSPLEKLVMPPPFETALLGAGLSPDDPRVREADPLSHLENMRCGVLLVHGDRDQVVPERQSRALHDAVVRAGGESIMFTVGAAGHEGPEFDENPVISMTAAWLLHQLRGSRK